MQSTHIADRPRLQVAGWELVTVPPEAAAEVEPRGFLWGLPQRQVAYLDGDFWARSREVAEVFDYDIPADSIGAVARVHRGPAPV